MDPRSRHSLMKEAIQYSLTYAPSPDTRLRNNTKRHAMFFPPPVVLDSSHSQDYSGSDDDRSASEFGAPAPLYQPMFFSPPVVLDSSHSQDYSGSDDNLSTWTFSAPAPLYQPRRNSAVSPYSTTSSTPAQEMASRYRAGLPLQAVLSGSSSNTSSSSHHRQSKRTTISTSRTSNRDFAHRSSVPYRQSRAEALQETTSEVRELMNRQGASEHDPVACGRVGCRNVLRDVNALRRHLHIHNLDDGSTTCPRCNQTLPSQKEYSSHVCRRRGRLQSLSSCSIATSPLKDTFFRVINKMNGFP